MKSSDKIRPDHGHQDPMERRSRELYREAARRIDPVTAGRLRAARRHALEAAQAPARSNVRWLIPTGAFAVLALAAMMVWQPMPSHQAVPTQQSASASGELDNDLPPDADHTDPNLYQNLDFYGWLAANDRQPANP
ncbi:MAG: hypothetical protein WC617_08095 [Rhodanobacter sp.]|jgi:hypothetical protein